MRIIISAAVSSDGYMDDSTPTRLIISNQEDWMEVHTIRASCDAILVGAETLRRDNPALIIRDERLVSERIAAGLPADITKVTVTSNGALDTSLRFFTEGADIPKIVFIRRDAPPHNIARLAAVAEIIRLNKVSAKEIAAALASKGYSRIIVEGGAKIIKMFIDDNAVDEFRLAVAPFSVGDTKAPRLPYFGNLPFENTAFKTTRNVGNMSVSVYLIHPGRKISEDRKYLQRAIEISRRCIPCDTAYCVGAVVVTASGKIFEGYTHETSPDNHAEEEAVKKALAAKENLKNATMYSSMEPCSTRRSKPVSCSELIIKLGFGRVVYAFREPDCFVNCKGTSLMVSAGIAVETFPDMEGQVREINSHIIGNRQ